MYTKYIYRYTNTHRHNYCLYFTCSIPAIGNPGCSSPLAQIDLGNNGYTIATSPNYPENYEDDTDCGWQVTVTKYLLIYIYIYIYIYLCACVCVYICSSRMRFIK